MCLSLVVPGLLGISEGFLFLIIWSSNFADKNIYHLCQLQHTEDGVGHVVCVCIFHHARTISLQVRGLHNSGTCSQGANRTHACCDITSSATSLLCAPSDLERRESSPFFHQWGQHLADSQAQDDVPQDCQRPSWQKPLLLNLDVFSTELATLCIH